MISMKFLPLLACIAFSLFPFTIVAQVTPKIAMVTHGQLGDPFWLVVRNAAETAARETNCDLDYRSPDHFDLAAMSHLIDEAVASKPDGLIVSMPDVAILGPSIRAAVAAGIPVILNALVNNQLEFAVDQQQWLQGHLPVVFLANYLKYGSMVQNDLILTGPSFVTPENARKALNILSSESGWNP